MVPRPQITQGYLQLARAWLRAASDLDNIELAEGSDRASSDGLLQLLDSLFECVGRKRFTDIELLLAQSIVARLAPEYLVGILRSTAHAQKFVAPWTTFRESVRHDFVRRGLDADVILSGLGGEATAFVKPSQK